MGDVTVPSTRRPRKSTGHSPVRKRMEKENITVDVASSLAGNGSRKKSRSKSMGPGGLDVLKSGSGNRRVSLAAPARPPPRSILKPTIPILPEIPPHKPKSRIPHLSANVQGAENTPSPFQNEDSSSSGTKVALRTEEEQQAAAREREEKERLELEKEIKDRREARRKSLANRRVSFAAEATLHTFHEVEWNQDSTTSSDSTRRASSAQSSAPDPTPSSTEPTDPPSTPPEQVEEPVPETPEHQRDLHQKKNRRSSALPPMSFNHGDDDHTVASTIYSSDSEATDGATEIHEEIHSDDGSDSDVDGTTMDLVVDEVTGTSVASGITARSVSPDDTNNTLDDVLRLATRQAQTQSFDEEEEIIPSFGWARKPAPKKDSPERHQPDQSYRPYNGSNEDTVDQSEMDMDMDMDMDFTKPMGGILKASNASAENAYDDEMSMDVTKALGGILPQQVAQPVRKSTSPQHPGDVSSTDDTTMDLTMAIGAIRQNNNVQDVEVESNAGYEDMSMELTTVLGAVLPSGAGGLGKRKSLPTRRQTLTAANDETMDMTVGMGRILPTSQALDDQDEEDATMGMDMTMAMGGIIRGASPVKDRTQAKQIMEEEVDRADSSPIMDTSSPRRRLSAAIGAPAPSGKAGSGLSPFHGKGLRHSMGRRTSDVSNASSPIRQLSPPKQTGPIRESSPIPSVQSSPLRTPSPGKPSSRTPSPQRSATTRGSFKSKSPFKSPQKGINIFQKDPSTGVSTPRVVLTPQPRRVSGVGADRSGLGSPKVAALFDRRESISDSASKFVPGKAARGVSFANPRIIEIEVDNERREEEDRENGRSILEREANGGDDDNTATLKDMIASMTPKKNNQFKGRKSLHVGSARGLLGKRPAELDDEDEEDRDGVKRLKGHQGSPVKNVHLHAPPTVAETTGRLTRSASHNLEEAASHAITPSMGLSPRAGPGDAAPSPRHQHRFKRVENDQPTDTFNFEEPPRPLERDLLDDDDEERIHLQDFLNMTSIRFMELTTTKRRHTQAPAALKDSTLHNVDDVSLERCVVAGACTVPMLELYQHSCRELKKYISEGRRIVREIETETFDENPPLFKEYISATPEFKLLMDNQFKNVKTHARLLSKAMWYEWRMKLQDGLKEGLVTIAKDMEDDEQLLEKEEKMLNAILPNLLKTYEALEQEHSSLRSVAQELAECDPQELEAARTELVDVDSDVAEKMRKIEELQHVLTETESTIQDMVNRKQECLTAIEEAEKIREECRGWSSKEISTLKFKVDEIEKEHGWIITGISGTMVSMTYRREIEVVFDIGAFQGAKSASHLDLWFIAANREKNPQPKSTEKDFFVQCIRDYARGLVQARTKVSTLLRAIGAAWNKADAAADDIRLLNCTFPTQVVRTSDSSIAAKVDMLLVPLETKVQLSLGLQSQHTPDGIEFRLVPQVQVVYGEHFKVDKVCEYLSTRIGERVMTKKENEAVESWSDVVVELHERLVARGRK